MLVGTQSNFIRMTAMLCAALLVPGDVPLIAQQQPSPATAPVSDEKPVLLPAEQLDSLVAPIALYPDELLAQVLAASTYPLEIVQLQQWLTKHPDLKDQKLAEAVQKEKWDPSVQGLAALPDVVKQMANSIQWTSELGNAFLAQQSGVMDAVQRMRSKATQSGKLKSNEQMKVETKTVESKSVVVIEQANPQVVYVPSYNPTVVWGAPAYAYPPVAYPPPGYYAAGMALSFGVGIAMGAMWGGGWGYNCGWGGNNTININNNNNFNRVSGGNRVNTGNRVNAGNRVGGGNTWQHNPQHRGGAPYGDRATARQFGGAARGEGAGTRQSSARQGLSQPGGAGGNSFRSGAGPAGGGAGGQRGAGGGDRIGNREISGGGASRGSGAFGGANRSGSAARSTSSRGSSSFGGSRAGGGGGSRGGGGGRRR